MNELGIRQKPPPSHMPKRRPKRKPPLPVRNLFDGDDVKGVLMTAPDRFRLGFVVGAGAMFVTGVIVLWYLSGGMG